MKPPAIRRIEEIEDTLDVGIAPADVKVYGRTLVNLLGRAGNAIYKQFSGNNLSINSAIEYEGDNFILKGPVGNDANWVTTIDTSHVFEKGKRLLVVGESYNELAEKSYVRIESTTTDTIRSVENDKSGTWQTIYNASIVGDAVGEHHKPYFAMVSIGTSSTVKFRYIRCYEITEEIYIKINIDPEYTGDKLVEKYPYVDNVKCVVNPYIECNENLIPISIQAEEGWVEDGKFIAGNSGVVYILNMDRSLPSGDYTINIENLPNKYTMGGLNSTHKKYLSMFHIKGTNGGVFYPICQVPGETGQSIDEIITNLKNGKWRVTLVKGSTPKAYDACHNSQIMFETKLYDGKNITRDNSGRYVKNSEWGELDIGGDVFPSYASKYAGFKGFAMSKSVVHGNILLNENWFDTSEPHQIVSYDGSLYSHTVSFTGSGGIPSMNFDPNPTGLWKEIAFTLPNTLTGWGDAYTPTQEEIKAFFLGWRMYKGGEADSLYNDTGEKQWAKLWCGVGEFSPNWTTVKLVSGSTVVNLPTTMNGQAYTPYKLIYKKETPTIEEVKTHGLLTVKDGVDLNVGSGLVLGEPINAHFYDIDGGNWYVNSGYQLAKHRVDDFLKIKEVNTLTTLPFNQRSITNISPEQAIFHGDGQAYIKNKPNNPLLIDYTIYKLDTVQSFPHTILTPSTIKKVLEKTIEELSNTNEKLSAENRELHNKIESLPLGSNPNLLINGDFQVWQRGERFDVAGGPIYCTDRFAVNVSEPNALSIDRVPNGIMYTHKQDALATTLEYRMEQSELDLLRGKTVTLSFSIDGVVHTSTHDNFNVTSGYILYIAKANVNAETVSIGNGGGIVYQFPTIPSGGSYTINWVKLELGDKATPLSPRPYAEELVLCQRYYRVMSIMPDMQSEVLPNSRFMSVSYDMRTTPTIKLETAGEVNIIKNASEVKYDILDSFRNSMQASIISTSSPIHVHAFWYALDVILDAEIY